jgi:cobalt/nickel transport system permease protein
MYTSIYMPPPAPPAMHIPDGFLNTAIAVICWVIAIAAIFFSIRRTEGELGERQAPLMGVVAAFIFAAQMLNFTVAGGTSGHFMGGALATFLLGPWAGILVMTTVVSIQALVFQDGGLLALGANITNMGVIGCLVSYGVIVGVGRMLGEKKDWSRFVGVAVAAWLSIVIASATCALQLAVSGTSPLSVALPAMAGVHMLIGIGEAIITVAALAFIAAARRDLLPSQAETEARGGAAWWVVGLIIALVVTLFSPLASAFPDGLERVAENLGFIDTALEAPYNIIPDYLFPGISNEALATIVAGVVGALIVFGVAYGVAYVRRKGVTA